MDIIKAPREVCDKCGYFIVWKEVGDNLVAFDPVSDTPHRCPALEIKPIGPAVKGKVIDDFYLRSRRAVFTMGSMTLEIDAGGYPLYLKLVTPEGVFNE